MENHNHLTKVLDIFKENTEDQQVALWISEELGTKDVCQLPMFIKGNLVEEYHVLATECTSEGVPFEIQNFGATRLIAFHPTIGGKQLDIVHYLLVDFHTFGVGAHCFWVAPETMKILISELFQK